MSIEERRHRFVILSIPVAMMLFIILFTILTTVQGSEAAVETAQAIINTGWTFSTYRSVPEKQFQDVIPITTINVPGDSVIGKTASCRSFTSDTSSCMRFLDGGLTSFAKQNRMTAERTIPVQCPCGNPGCMVLHLHQAERKLAQLPKEKQTVLEATSTSTYTESEEVQITKVTIRSEDTVLNGELNTSRYLELSIDGLAYDSTTKTFSKWKGDGEKPKLKVILYLHTDPRTSEERDTMFGKYAGRAYVNPR